ARSGDGCGERFVRSLPAAEVAERRRMIEVAHANGANLGQPRLDPVPRGMLEVERESQRRVERAEQQLQDALVALRLERDPHRPKAVPEVANAVLEFGDGTRPLPGELRGELESVGHLFAPPPELLLGR